MLDEAGLETIIRNFIAGEYDSALRVVGLQRRRGLVAGVSEDIAGEIIDRAYYADETLTEGTKRFISTGKSIRIGGHRHARCN